MPALLRIGNGLLIGATFAAAMVATPITAQAQEAVPVAEEFQQSRTLNEAKRQATIGANVNFTREESSQFWPLFWEYRTEVNRIDDEAVQIIGEYAESLEAMSNQKAKALTEAWLEVEFERYQQKKAFVEKLSNVLSSAKTMRVMQIGNKLDAMVNLSLSKRIPLVPVAD